MARKSIRRPWAQPHREISSAVFSQMRHTEVGPSGVDYQVQVVGKARKEYRCPGCQQVIPVGSKHVVVWPEETVFGHAQGMKARRHWHQECWRRRLRPTSAF